MRRPSGRHTTPATLLARPPIVFVLRGIISDVACSSAVGEDGDEECEDMLIARGFQLGKLLLIRYFAWKLERAF
jgi:hypothetical protein